MKIVSLLTIKSSATSALLRLGGLFKRSSDKIVRRHMSESNDIPEHESPVRRMMADARGTPFHPLRTLDEARQHDDGVAILQGDWGGQIYAVIPARMIRCSPDTMQQLLLDLDTEAWSCKEHEGASIYYERQPAGTGVAGGMGGGASTGELWVHPEFDEIAEQIRRVIIGEQGTISVE